MPPLEGSLFCPRQAADLGVPIHRDAAQQVPRHDGFDRQDKRYRLS